MNEITLNLKKTIAHSQYTLFVKKNFNLKKI